MDSDDGLRSAEGPPMQTWGILGAGMLGLTLALRLAERGEQVTVLDAAAEPGGLASAWQVGDIQWDRYYHVISLSDTKLQQLLDELGLADSLRFKTTRTNFFDGSNLWPLNNAFDYLRLPALSLLDKMRVGYTILRASRIRDLRPLESIDAQQWLVGLGGQQAWQRLWRPLLRTKLGSNIDHASAAYMCSVIQRFYGAREGGAQREMFGYVEGGYGRIIDSLVTRLRELGVRFVGAAPVQQVVRDGESVKVSTTCGEFRFRRAVVTFAAPLAARLCTDLDGESRAALQAIRYQGIVCASVVLKRPLGNAYMTYITDDSMPFTTIIEMSSLVDREAFAGKHLAYLPQYLPADDSLFEQTDEALSERFMAGLLRMFADLTSEDVVAMRITRARHVMAIPGLHYSRQLPAMQTAVPGLWIANSAQIINSALTVNESVILANDVARQLLSARGDVA